MENYKLYEDFKDEPILLQEILYKNFLKCETGCIGTSYDEYYSLLKGKEILLSEIYDEESLEYLKIEMEEVFSKEYFLSNKFIFLEFSDGIKEGYDDLKKFKSSDNKIEFCIFLVGACECDYDCCTKITLRYQEIK